MTSRKIAGVLLTAAMICWIAMILAWSTLVGSPNLANPEGGLTVLDRAQHLIERQEGFRTVWIIEALAAMGLAIAAVTLLSQTRDDDGPEAMAWSAVAVGAIVYVGMYGVMLGTYPLAAAAADASPAVLASAIGSAIALFFLSNVAFNAGFAALFFAQVRKDTPLLPRWAAWAGAMLSLLGCLASLAGLVPAPEVARVADFDAFAVIAIVHFVLVAWLGIGIARKR